MSMLPDLLVSLPPAMHCSLSSLDMISCGFQKLPSLYLSFNGTAGHSVLPPTAQKSTKSASLVS